MSWRSKMAARDMSTYRKGYPRTRDNPSMNKNLEFYTGIRKCQPDDMFIDDIHRDWWGHYSKLEAAHGYVQWLFPIRECGLNHLADPLQLHEAKSISENPIAQNRIIKSYELMLDFYGMQLDRTTGAVSRNSDYRNRYSNLNMRGHNFLRITRILKCLGEVGLEHFKLPWLKHLATEMFVHKKLLHAYTSLTNYWRFTLRNAADETALDEHIKKMSVLGRSNPSEMCEEYDEDRPRKRTVGVLQTRPKSRVVLNISATKPSKHLIKRTADEEEEISDLMALC